MKQETLEEAAKKYDGENAHSGRTSFIAGAKWQQERMYSEEEVLQLLNKRSFDLKFKKDTRTEKEWFEQFKNK